jgi:1-acyl-sn-glycerol-3-phosphate acyltransferase
VARKRGWPILEFSSRGSGGLMGQVRTLLGVGSVVPAAYSAIGWGLLTGSRRRGINVFTTAFPQLLLAINVVDLNVVGEENLKKKRPAVFIFNHRNNFDPVIVGALVKDNWTGVGKKELQSDPVMGTLGKLVDTVFIDREDPKAAVESLKQAEELARKGLSVVIAPEGTRLDTRSVGTFKKGPFRLAMSAGVPIVPRGAGTGLSGGATPHAQGVLLSTAKMSAILAIDPVARTARVQPGVRNLAISEAAARHGLYYAPDPSSQIACSIGGNVAENSGGVHCLKYGLTVHNVLRVRAVTLGGAGCPGRCAGARTHPAGRQRGSLGQWPAARWQPQSR